ncbi:MAG: hypothetical protein KDA68_14820, partial [Planctomycetaceae bacterium]|nr:hypothetical protein [Planctomycetaceae bacterium]
MHFDWLKSLRPGYPRRRKLSQFATPAPLESRTLLSAGPIGSEVRVSTYTVSNQVSPSIAMDADGDYVITWSGNIQDGSGYGIYAQRYNSLRQPQGNEFRVNVWTTGKQEDPVIAMDADGDFVIAWTSELQDGSGTAIAAQRYNAAGVPQGTELHVNTWTDSYQINPSIAMDADGDFVIAWSSFLQDGGGFGIYAQRYNALGAPQGAEFRVNTSTNTDQLSPSIAMDALGDFVISWRSFGQDGQYNGIYAQRFDSAGVPQGSEFQVNTWTSLDQRYQSVGMDADGDFVIAWQSNLQDGSGYGIYAQRYNALGVPQGSEFLVNSTTAGNQVFPAVDMDDDGDFIITWMSKLQDGSGYGIYAQRYNALGVPQDSEFRVSTYTSNDQSFPAIAMDAGGDFIITWQSNLQDGSGWGIYGIGFNFTPTNIELSNSSLAEYEHLGALIGTFSSTDTNSSESFTYSLVAGEGDTGNAAFTIVGNQLQNAVVFDYEAQDTYSIRVRTTDLGGLTFEKVFSISVIDVSEIGAIPLGSEFRVSNVNSGDVSIGIDSEGNFVITQSVDRSVYSWRYNALGVPQGAAFGVDSIAGYLREAVIAMNPDGGFVIAWEDNHRVYAQRFDPLGISQGSAFTVSNWTTNTSFRPTIAIDEDGDFVVAWTSYGRDGSSFGIFARRFDSLGNPQGSDFQVNSRTQGNQNYSAIAIDADGDFVVTWQSGGDGWDYGIYAQRYNASGLPLGSEFRVNTWTTFFQGNPSIAMDADGDFVISWHSDGPDESGSGIAAQRYNRFGEAIGSEFIVNSWTTDSQTSPSIAMNAAGDFVITWVSYEQDGASYGVFAQVFDSHGAAQGAEFRVNNWTSAAQSNPSVAMNSTGDFVISWRGSGQSGLGVYAQRYTILPSGPNQAPLLDNAGAPFLNPILQNAPSSTNIGTLVSDIIAHVAPSGSISDPDSDPLGIAINGVSNANGSWEYTVNGGTTWAPIAVTG